MLASFEPSDSSSLSPFMVRRFIKVIQPRNAADKSLNWPVGFCIQTFDFFYYYYFRTKRLTYLICEKSSMLEKELYDI